MKQLAVQENIALFVAVVLCTAFLLAVAYRAWAVFGSRRYMHRSDLLSHTFSQAETEERIAGIHRMGRIFAVAVVNVAYIALAFICSFQRIFGRFELSSFVSFLFSFSFFAFTLVRVLTLCCGASRNNTHSAFALTVGAPASLLAFAGSFMI